MADRSDRRDSPGGLSAFLSALQLSDSAFPTGRYTLSHGLEAMTQSGLLAVPSRPDRLVGLLTDQIRAGVAPSDGVALACAHRACADSASIDLEAVLEADLRLTAVKLGREARETSTRTGRALLNVAAGAFGGAAASTLAVLMEDAEAPCNHAVVLGMVSAALGVPRLEAVAGELYAFAASWVSAAVRLAVTDHRTAQAVLHQARPMVVQAALEAADQDVGHISSCTPLLDLVSMQHEESELRLFAS